MSRLAQAIVLHLGYLEPVCETSKTPYMLAPSTLVCNCACRKLDDD